MALSKAIETAYGFPAQYHRIVSAHFYWGDGCVDVFICGYASAEARQADMTAPLKGEVRLQLSALPPEATRADLYEALKRTEAYGGAEDA